MSNSENCTRISGKPAWHACCLAVLTTLGSFAATNTLAADNGNLSNARAIYQQDRAQCNSGQSNQDRATCLKEAGAAYNQARRGRASEDSSEFERNALKRCDRLSHQDRRACRRRIRGEGVTEGSVDEGGLYRKIEITIPPR